MTVQYPPRTDVPATPPPELRYRRELELGSGFSKLFASRSVLVGLVTRQVRSQYSQQLLGLAWTLITPLAQTALFTVLLGQASKTTNTARLGIPPDLPKALWLYVGLLFWSFYASSVQTAANSLVANPLLNKVYAPREVFPIAQVMSSGINLVAGAIVLPVMFLASRYGPTGTIWWVPVLMVPLVVFTVAVALLFSATTVFMRDLRSALPLVLQLGMFMPGVLYSKFDAWPELWRVVYAIVFPAAPLIDAMRSAVLLGEYPGMMALVATLATVGYMLAAFVYFKRLETGFADVS